jgi:hypothetical protein
MHRLATELKTFEAQLPALLGTSESKFVLIKGEKVVGVFDNQIGRNLSRLRPVWERTVSCEAGSQG